MKILNCSYLQKESFEDCFPYWGLCREWMKCWFNLKVNEDWSHPIHIASECNYWRFTDFEKITLKTSQVYHWRPTGSLPIGWYATLFFREPVKGFIETPNDVVLIENYQLYLDREFKITNEDTRDIEFYVGSIQFDPIADDVPVSLNQRQIEYLQSHQRRPDALPKRYIVLTHFETINPEVKQLYWNLEQMGSCRMVYLSYTVITRHGKTKFVLKEEEKYLDDFEIQYYHRDIPEKWKNGDEYAPRCVKDASAGDSDCDASSLMTHRTPYRAIGFVGYVK